VSLSGGIVYKVILRVAKRISHSILYILFPGFCFWQNRALPFQARLSYRWVATASNAYILKFRGSKRLPIGRVLMATGRDAADVAMTTSFGQADVRSFFIVTKEEKTQ